MVARKLAINWGVIPILFEGEPSDLKRLNFAVKRARESGYLKAGDIVVSTSGHHQQAGGTDLIRVVTLEE